MRVIRGFAEGSLVALGFGLAILLSGTPLALLARGVHEGLSWLVRLRGETSAPMEALVSVSSVLGTVILVAVFVRRSPALDILYAVDFSALRRGEPQHVIPEFVVSEGIDVLVMGTVARSGISGMLMGNRAERVLRKLPCSVLTVKPDGFASPVRLANA